MLSMRRRPSVIGRTQSEMTSMGNTSQERYQTGPAKCLMYPNPFSFKPYRLKRMKTTSADPSVMERLVVAIGNPGNSAMKFAQKTKQAEVAMSGKYFFARFEPITSLASV